MDEAQDLHPAQWRLLRALASEAPDDMFLVGDPHQRIYDNRASLASLGIQVRGRSRRLEVSYRTTEEILAWAIPVLGLAPVTGIDGDPDSLAGYHSPLHGGRPVVLGCRDQAEELAALAERVRQWLAEGVEPHAIGVAARTGQLVKDARAALQDAGVRTAGLTDRPSEAVRVGTMHRMKGLEFQCVAVIGVAAGTVPSRLAVTPATEDPTAHTDDLQRERCLLFVACTRARDRLAVSYAGEPSPFLTG